MTLQNYVKRLRHALADADHGRISTEPNGHRINADAGELDVTRFGTLLELSRKAAWCEQWDDAAAILREALSLRRRQAAGRRTLGTAPPPARTVDRRDVRPGARNPDRR